MEYNLKNMKILVTGAAGFIGFHLSRMLCEAGAEVVGADKINDYYEVSLKEDRLAELEKYPNFSFVRADIASQDEVEALFERCRYDRVVNLAAQAGVRHSVEVPRDYADANLMGFFNILDASRRHKVAHLIYASSSSVYGNQQKTPFSVTDNTGYPISFYAATKKANELMAHSYTHIYGIPTTGVRFFTVYGPYGRPDMAYFNFTRTILDGEPIKVFNHGDMLRDFTYVDDIVRGLCAMIAAEPEAKAKIYNIGNNKPVKLGDFINTVERALSKKLGREINVEREYLPMQQGDVYQTWADIDDLQRDFGFSPDTTIEEGIERFIEWYVDYYNVK